MSDLSVITITPGSGDTVKVVLEKLRDDRILIASHFIDTVFPASPFNGMVAIDSTDVTRLKAFLRQNGAWAAMVLTHILEQNMDFDRFQAVRMLLERLATAPTPAAAERARAIWNTTLDQMQMIRTADVLTMVGTKTDGGTGDTKHEIGIPMEMRASPATPATADVVTEFGGWLIDTASKELALISEPVPESFVGDQDLAILLTVLLENAEGVGDDIEIDYPYISVTPNAGEGAGKTETAPTTVTLDIGSNNAQHDLFEIRLPLVYNDAANDVAPGDTIRATIGSPLTEVAGLIVTKAKLLVPVRGQVHHKEI